MLNFNKKKYVSFDNLKSFNGLLQSSLKEKIDGYKSEVDTKVQKKFNELSGKVQTDSEVIDARKGEASLRAKIDVIDEDVKNVSSQLEHIAINVKDFDAKGDGLSDDTQAFINAIKYCKDNKFKKLYIPDGTYIIDSVGEKSNDINVRYGKIFLHSNFTMELSKLATLKIKPNDSTSYACITIKDADNVSIHGGNIVGEKDLHTGSAGEWGYGILIESSHNVTIDNMNISNCWGDCIDLRSDSEWVNPPKRENKNITITNCILSNSRRQGVSIESGINILIDNCYFEGIRGTTPQSCIDIEGNGREITKNIKILNSTFMNSVNGICLWTAEDTIISNCYFEGQEELNIKSIPSSKNVCISNSTFKDRGIQVCFGDAIVSNNKFYESSLTITRPVYDDKHFENIKIDSNIFINSNIKTYFSDNNLTLKVSNVELTNNIISYENGYGIDVSYINSLSISNNLILNSLGGIYNLYTHNIQISNNELKNIKTSGIVLGDCNISNINNNIIKSYAIDVSLSTYNKNLAIVNINTPYTSIKDNIIYNDISTQRNVGIKIDSEYSTTCNNSIFSSTPSFTGLMVVKSNNIVTHNDLRCGGDTKIYVDYSVKDNIIENNYGVI